jgi:pyruvate-formate lyase
MLTIPDRLQALRATKLAHTYEKQRRHGAMDHDDHGIVPPPVDFAWQPTPNHPSGCFFGYAGWGANFRALLEAHPVYVDPVDALAGRYMVYLHRYKHVGWKPECSYAHLQAEQRRYGIVSGIGAPHHFAPDYRIGLTLGWGGLLAKIARCRAEQGPEKAEFFDAEADCVLGIQDWIRRTVVALQAAEAVETRPELRANLQELIAANAWLVDGAPRTLREACQWLAWATMACRMFNGSGAGGQLDVLLWPYYARDLAAGRIDDETAIYYLAGLLLSDTQYHQVGGPGADGTDVANHLSFLLLEAAHRVSIAANLTVRVHDGMNRELFLQSVRYLFEDRQGWPRYSGDKGLVAGFMRNGYPAELARERIAVGCHWMAIPGREYTLNDCVKINCAKVFAVALEEMLADRSVPPSVENLWSRFDTHLERAIACTARGLDFHCAHQWENNPELMLNLLCHGTLERGLDASGGGVDYYNMCVDGSALATVADSFAALEQRIEGEGRLTWDEVATHLRENFSGVAGERVRLMLRHSARYGQGGGSLGDHWAVRLSRRFTELVKAGPTPGGLNMIPGWFSWSNTIGMGREVGATPNGRKAGEPIAHGANPDPGFRRDGAPTALVQAIAAVQPGFGNTAPVQLEFDPGISKEEGGIERVASLIKTHFDLGGTLFNINVLDREMLQQAHADPTRHPDLVVRVTGFTAFFASLSPEFRQLVIERFISEG